MTNPEDLICLTVDVEWAHDEVLADLVRLFDEHGLRATFFCTHDGIEVAGHERALHPNYRRNGDTLRRLRAQAPGRYATMTDGEVFRYVVQDTKVFCPEATGVRAHSLHYDSELIAIYHEEGLEYDSSYCMTLAEGIHPLWKEHDILELPIYYMDHLDITQRLTGFDLDNLKLEQPGLKVFDFHPNIVYTNAPTDDFYVNTKSAYHDPDELRRLRHAGRGPRTLLVNLLDRITAHKLPTATLAEVNDAWRKQR